jgi:hypothetical protein
MPFLIAWRAFVLAVLWGWFVVPLGAVSLTVPVAAGILVTHFLFVKISPRDLDDADEKKAEFSIKAIFISVFTPAYCLILGWLVTFFL